jgi:CBS domain-containing protein
MAAISSATPLIALDAVVVDTETTGLEPAKARVVEIGAVRIVRGRRDGAPPFRRLVRPGVPIPAAATRVHGIDDTALAGASSFAEVWPDFTRYLGDTLVIGHSIGFDLAVLKRECERADIAWVRPRTLDTRLLAEVAEPELAGYSLDELAAWLGVEVAGRHSAIADAGMTAQVFTALLPKLREGGIRTLGEAMRACRALTNVLDEQHRAGWLEAVEAPSRLDAERTLSRIDSYPYRHRIREVMRSPARFVAADVALGDALQRMTAEQISSVFLHPANRPDAAWRAADAGVVTERDALRALAVHGADALAMPADRFASRPLEVVSGDAFVYRAIGRMNRLKVRHLGVVDDAGHVVGALSARDLLRLRAGEAVALGEEIDEAHDAPGLAAAWAKLPRVAASLAAEGVAARGIADVISRELGALTGRAGAIAEARVRGDGHGGPPCSYAVSVLGSAGRGESLLAMDQDNALIFADGAPDGPEDRWFERLGIHIADILHEAGVPYCKGGVMAKNPQWRGSRATWRARIDDWIRRSSAQDLLSVDIFFDMRPVHGDGGLCTTLWRDAFDAASGEIGFAKLLAEAAGGVENGLGLFGRFRTSRGRIDLKKAGLFGIVTAARVLAIRHHIVAHSTPARLAGVKALGLGAETDLDALVEAQATLLDLVLAQQIEDIAHGTQPSNAVAVKRLSFRDRARLRSALESVRHLDDLTRDLLFKD